MLISEGYRNLNAELHATSESYGTSGAKWAPAVDQLARRLEAKSVLDYGCGRGTLKAALAAAGLPPYQIWEYDPALPEKATKPLRADIVVCGDVLEHIEPECLYAVLDDICNIAGLGVFLVVATVPAAKTLADGRNAHLIVEPAHWWLPKIMDRWRLQSYKDYGPVFKCVGMAR